MRHFTSPRMRCDEWWSENLNTSPDSSQTQRTIIIEKKTKQWFRLNPGVCILPCDCCCRSVTISLTSSRLRTLMCLKTLEWFARITISMAPGQRWEQIDIIDCSTCSAHFTTHWTGFYAHCIHTHMCVRVDVAIVWFYLIHFMCQLIARISASSTFTLNDNVRRTAREQEGAGKIQELWTGIPCKTDSNSNSHSLFNAIRWIFPYRVRRLLCKWNLFSSEKFFHRSQISFDCCCHCVTCNFLLRILFCRSNAFCHAPEVNYIAKCLRPFIAFQWKLSADRIFHVLQMPTQ